MSLASKLATLEKKAVKLEVVEVTNPVNSVDLLDQFKAASGPTFDVANEFTLDVFPDFRPIICFVMMLANRAATAADFKTHAKLSPPTIVMYYMTIIYAHFLACDAFVRPVPSIHARIWKTEALRHEFLKFLLSLPVPEEIEFILKKFAPTCTERTKNVFAIPSFAGFEHHRFFGRYLPIKSFTDIHNTVASVPGNSSPGTIYKHLFKNAVAFTIDNPSWSFNLGDFLGINITSANDIAAPATRLFQVFETVFNPVLFRDFHRRSSLARIPLEIPEFESDRYNPIDMIFSFSPQNVSELEIVLRSAASILKNTVTMKSTLSAVIAASSGNSIFAHGYSISPMPTFSYNKSVKYSSITKDSELDSISVTKFAASIGYLQKSSIPKQDKQCPAIKTVEASSGKDSTTTNLVSWNQAPLTAANPGKSDASTELPKEDSLILFSPADHVAPRVRVLDVSGTQTVDAYLSTLCGMVIESFELDGTTVPVPNTNMSLGLENSHFADSAMPINLTIPASQYDHDPTVTGPPPPQERKVDRETSSFAASLLLFDRTQIRSPILNGLLRDNVTAGWPFPGWTFYPTNWIRSAQSFIGFRTVAPDAPTSSTDEVERTPKKSFYAWSPYTVTTRQDPRASRNDSQYNRTYFIMNLGRSLFGTDYNFVELNGASHAMPAS